MGKKYISTAEAAKLLGISRIAVYKRIKTGRLKAEKFGRNFVVDINKLGNDNDIVIETKPSEKKEQIDRTMEKVWSQYSEALKKLGDE